MDAGVTARDSSAAGSADSKSLVVVLPDAETVALAVATAVVAEARRAVARKREFSVALSGGSTPRRAYELLGEPPFANRLPWGSTHIFWGDERCVDPDDARSNEAMARAAMLDHVPVPAAQVHPMRCAGINDAGAAASDAAKSAQDAADEYETLLRTRGAALDLALLGLGQDGHTASLFPGSDAARERDRWVSVARQTTTGEVTSGGDPLWRVTLTAPYINQTGAVFFVVTGADKAGALRQVLEDDTAGADRGGAKLPARSIAPASGRSLWFVDEEAAAQLQEVRLLDAGRG